VIYDNVQTNNGRGQRRQLGDGGNNRQGGRNENIGGGQVRNQVSVPAESFKVKIQKLSN
jgi:hypothetical protein